MAIEQNQEFIEELRRQIGMCENQVNAYSNKRDKDSRHMWYYWYGRREACEQMLAYLQNNTEQPVSQSFV